MVGRSVPRSSARPPIVEKGGSSFFVEEGSSSFLVPRSSLLRGGRLAVDWVLCELSWGCGWEECEEWELWDSLVAARREREGWGREEGAWVVGLGASGGAVGGMG